MSRVVVNTSNESVTATLGHSKNRPAWPIIRFSRPRSPHFLASGRAPTSNRNHARRRGLEFALTQVLVLRQLHDDVAPRPAHRHHGLGAATGERVLDGGHTAGLQLVGNDLLRGRISRFSLDALVNIVAALGRRVNIELEVG